MGTSDHAEWMRGLAARVTFAEGGVSAPAGIRAAGLHVGFRDDPQRLDAALVVAEGEHPVAAGMFTRNRFCAAPVQVSKDALADGHARAVILNSGNANAATGAPGLELARKTQERLAAELGVERDDVLVGSTGVIGVELPWEPFESGIPALVGALADDGGAAAARAIMTTDTRPKECAARFEWDGRSYTVGGMCKGSGMIQPDMATMLAAITTDVPVTPEAAKAALARAVNASFNKVTVDSDTSTNDSVFFLSSAAAQGTVLDAEDFAFAEGEQQGGAFPRLLEYEFAALFGIAVQMVCETLARKIAADGEGATKLVTVNVRGAASAEDADAAARTVANSPLVKTAIAGHDCNWGRIAAALGRSGAAFEAGQVDIDIMGLPVLRQGLPCGFDEDEALRRFEQDEVVIDADLHAGGYASRVWTCDLTHGYVSINADYRT